MSNEWLKIHSIKERIRTIQWDNFHPRNLNFNFNTVVSFLAILGVIGLIVIVFLTRRTVPIIPPLAAPAVSPYEHFIAGTGIIEANTDNVQIGTQVPGVVDKVLVKAGDQVKKGTPLFVLDQRQTTADIEVKKSLVEQAITALKQAKALLKSSKDSFDLAENLEDKRAISKDEYLTRKNTYLINKAAYETAQANLKVAQDQLAQNLVIQDLQTTRAPFDGEILQINIHPGEYAATGQNTASSSTIAPLMLFGNTHNYHVRVDVDENDAWRFQKGTQAVAFPRGNGDIKLDLNFTRLEPYVSPKTSLTGASTERVDIRVLHPIYEFNPEGKPIYPGQQVDIFIEVIPEKDQTSEGNPS